MRARLIAAVVLTVAAATATAQRYHGRPWLGVSLAQGKRGVLVKQVVPDTPADQAGLMPGDEIVAVGDYLTPTPTELIEVVTHYRVGDEVSLDLQRGDKKVATSATLAVRMDVDTVVRKVLIDKVAPGFDLPVLSGSGSGKLSDYRGRVVIVEFFAVDCKYCPSAHADVAAAVATHGSDGLAAIAVSSDDRQALANYLDPTYQPKERIIKTHRGDLRVREPHYGELGFTAVHDASGETKGDYWVQVFPTFAVLDRQGFVRHVGSGAGHESARAIAAAVALLDEGR